MKKLMTLCLVQQGSKILLGLKKRGFGQGRWNGFGGKVLAGETIENAAKRELFEESGIKAENLELAGILDFEFTNDEEPIEMNLFRVSDFSGNLTESDEMKPQWFETTNLPFSKMWPDDKYWMPLFLSGKKFQGKFLFEGFDKIFNLELKILA